MRRPGRSPRCSGPRPRGACSTPWSAAWSSSEFLRQSRVIAEAWGKAGARTRYEEIAGTNHFTVIDALPDPQSAMVARLAELAQTVQSQ